MDHSWRPRPIQGTNICPTCSISHFPFCPPHPHPHPHPSTHHGPNFGPNLGPPHPGRPVYGNHPDPYHDPGHWGRNTHVDHSVGYNNYNNCYDNVNDGRSSKRLRVDGVYPSSYGGESGGNFSKTVGGGGEMRPNFVNGYGGPNLGYVDGENARMMHKMEAGYPVETGCGYGTGYRVTPDVELSRLENEFQSRVHHSGQFGQVAKPPPAFSHGGFGQESDGQNYAYRPPNYEYGQSNGANMVTPGQYPNTNPSFLAANVQPGHLGYGYQSPQYVGGVRQPINQNVRPFVPPNMSQQSEYGNEVPRHVGHGQQPPQGFDFQPPLPSSPPPPLPKEPPVHWSAEHKFSASPRMESPSLFPVQYRSSAAVQYSYPPTPDSHVLPNPHLDNYKMDHASRGTFQGVSMKDSHSISTSFGQHSGGRQSLPSQSLPSKNIADKPKTVDAVHLFKQPHRTSRPDHFVIILRGLPGSGKSYIAKMLRDLELEHGGNAPRIHSMDDYFMTEVDKTEENETSKALARGKKSVTKTVIEYCYEPEMEEAYRSSMLKAFKKTLEEGVYTFVIVDDRNLRVADFAQFWATAKRSGYEAYVLEAPYKDPAGCTARNVHGFTQDEVEKMAAKWEEASSLYLQLDVKSLFHGDDLKEGNIEEVDMDTEDEDINESSSKFDERQAEKTSVSGNSRPDVSPKDERNSDAAVVSNGFEEVKELGRSKWSDDLDDDGDERTELLKGKASVLSGLLGTYGKEGRSVHWGDQSERSGFSIGAVKKAKAASLIIGPGTGYNLKSNPLPEEENTKSGKSEETKKHKMFKERLQAEHDSFRAVFDRRRHRVGVLTEED